MMIKLAVVGSRSLWRTFFLLPQNLEGIEIDPYIYFIRTESF